MADLKGYQNAYQEYMVGRGEENSNRNERHRKELQNFEQNFFGSDEDYIRAKQALEKRHQEENDIAKEEHEDALKEKREEWRKEYGVSEQEAQAIEANVDKKAEQNAGFYSPPSNEEEYKEEYATTLEKKQQEEKEQQAAYDQELKDIKAQYPEGSKEREDAISALDQRHEEQTLGREEAFEKERDALREKHGIDPENASDLEQEAESGLNAQHAEKEQQEQDRTDYKDAYKQVVIENEESKKEARGEYHKQREEIENDGTLSAKEKEEKIAELNKERKNEIKANDEKFKSDTAALQEKYGITPEEAKKLEEEAKAEQKAADQKKEAENKENSASKEKEASDLPETSSGKPPKTEPDTAKTDKGEDKENAFLTKAKEAAAGHQFSFRDEDSGAKSASGPSAPGERGIA